MPESVYSWSTTASSNANADPGIGYPEGQLPGTLNNSARAMMAALAKLRDDQGGKLVTTGSSNAYVLTTASGVSALADGVEVAFVASFTNTAAATLNVDALGAKALRKGADAALAAGDIVAGAHYTARYDASANAAAGAWLLPSAPGSGEVITGAFSLTGDLTPPLIGAPINDYAPTGHATASVFRLSSDATREITGIAGGADGRVLVLMNIGAQEITLKDENIGSTAANRFELSGDYTLFPAETAVIQYDSTASRWRTISTTLNLGTVPVETTPGAADSLLMLDAFFTPPAPRRVTYANAFTAINGLTAETAVAVDDQLLLYDTSAGTADKVAAALINPFGLQFLHVRDEKASGTAGGSTTASTQLTRVLNTVKTNEIVGASLSANEIILPAGTYYIEAFAPSFDVDQNKIRLRNITDSTTTIVGTSENSSSISGSVSSLSGKFTIAAQKNFQIQHWVFVTRATTGFGTATSNGDIEVYTDVKIWKLS